MTEKITIEVGTQGPPGVGTPVGGATGEVLKKVSGTDYDTEWAVDSVEVSTLNSVGDVTITTPANGEVLKYNFTSGHWENQTDDNSGVWGSITGTLSSQTDLQSALDGKSDTTHNHDATYSPIVHTHVEADITDLQSYLLNINGESIEDLGDVDTMTPVTGDLFAYGGSSWGRTYSINDAQTNVTSVWTSQKISTELALKSNTTHNHDADYSDIAHVHASNDLSDVTVTTPADKHVLVHNGAGQFVNRVLVEADISDLGSYISGVAWGDVTGTLSAQTDLQSALDGKADSSHAHATADITSGTFADARVAQTNVTQHQAALSITESQISDLAHFGGALNDLTDATITTPVAGDVFMYDGANWVNDDTATLLFPLMNGTSLAHVDVTVTSNGTVVTCNVQKDGGGNFDVYLENQVYPFTATGIALTAGTDTAPTRNWVFIELDTGVATLKTNTTGYPTTGDFAAIGDVYVQSAASVQTYGAYKVHVWSDHVGNDNNGHISHVNYWMRKQFATWVSGVAPTITITTNPVAPDNVHLSSTVGSVLQLHDHVYPVMNTDGGEEIYVVNDNTTPYNRVTDLNALLTDSLGVSLSGKSFNLVVWGVVNESEADCKIMVNLPTGSYNQADAAIADGDHTSVFTMPDEFKGTGFLIARVTLTHGTADSGTWTEDQTEDLRGMTPNLGAGAGGGGSISDHGLLNGLGDDDHTQYHTDARGDARYYTETELDAGQLDNRYYTESEVDSLVENPMFPVDGWAKESTSTTGTGSVTLLGAESSFLSLDGTVGFDENFYYHIESSGAWEYGKGFIAGPTTTPHRYWRLNVTDTASGDGNHSLGEFKLYETTTGPNVAGDALVVTLSNIPAPGTDYNDDNNATGGHQTFGGAAFWVKYDFGSGTEIGVAKYQVGVENGYFSWQASDWTLEYSDNDSDWFVVDTVVDELSWSNDENREFLSEETPVGGDVMTRSVIRSSNSDALVSLTGTSYVSAVVPPEAAKSDLRAVGDVYSSMAPSDEDVLYWDNGNSRWDSKQPLATDTRMATEPATFAINPTAGATQSIVIGDTCDAATGGANNIVIGHAIGTDATTDGCTLIGKGAIQPQTTTGDRTTVVGHGNRCHNTHGVVIGTGNDVNKGGTHGVYIGTNQFDSVGGHDIFIGRDWNCDQLSSHNVVIGPQGAYLDSLDNSIIIGEGASQSAFSTNRIHIGFDLGTAEDYSGALGADATARDSGHFAQSWVPFVSAGDSQTSQIIMKVQTTDATVTELVTHGAGYLNMADDTTIMYEMNIVARRTDVAAELAGYKITFVADRGTGVASVVVFAPTIETLHETNAGWDVAVTADTTNGRPKITVQGEAAKTVRWTAFVRTVEVAN